MNRSTKLIYWISTALFAAIMFMSGVPNIMVNADSVAFVNGILQYPIYFIPFIGVAKVVGAVALVVPGYYRIKEWAYAGLMFDLVAAVYSQVAVAGWQPQLAFMLAFIAPGAVSYVYFTRLYRVKVVSE